MNDLSRISDGSLPVIYRDQFKKDLEAVSVDLGRILDHQPEKTRVSAISTFAGALFLDALFPKFHHPVVISLAVNAFATQVFTIIKLTLQLVSIDKHEVKLKELEVAVNEAKKTADLCPPSQKALKSDIAVIENIISQDRKILQMKQISICWNMASRIVQLPAVILLSVGLIAKAAPLFIAGLIVTCISYALSRKSIEKSTMNPISSSIIAFNERIKMVKNPGTAEGYSQMHVQLNPFLGQVNHDQQQFVVPQPFCGYQPEQQQPVGSFYDQSQPQPNGFNLQPVYVPRGQHYPGFNPQGQ